MAFEKKEAPLDSKYRETLYAASHYPHTSKLCSQIDASSVTSEDQKSTTRLAPACAKDYDSTATADTSVSEIELDSLRRFDQILIETAQSVYVFTIKDPKALSGRLIGGVLGNRLVDAYLLPSWVESSESRIAHKCIKAGVKFIFVIEAGIGPQRLITSTVKLLVHRKKPGAARPLNYSRRVTLEQVSD